jgi:hypothetical protein
MQRGRAQISAGTPAIKMDFNSDFPQSLQKGGGKNFEIGKDVYI